MDTTVDPALAHILAQLRKWRDELINLSRNNRLLYFRHTKGSTLNLTSPDATELLSRLTRESTKGLPFFEPPDEGDEPGELLLLEAADPSQPRRGRRGPSTSEVVTSCSQRSTLLSILRNLERRTTQEYMDKGLWTLYLGVGALEWREAPGDDGRVTSPIYLVPVSVHRDNPQAPFRLRRADEDPAINPALSVKLEHDFGITLPSIEDVEDESPERLFDLTREAVADQGDWAVRGSVVLASFSFHKEVMYRDLVANEAEIVAHPIVRSLAAGAKIQGGFEFEVVPEDRLDDEVPPEQVVAILDVDASQRQCMAAARQGRSFIMDGPPGTGKSQTIANIIADLLALNKTVLFVSEKAAALEVVQARLQQAGLADFLLELHSHKATRKEVARTLGDALTTRVTPRAIPSSIDLMNLVQARGALSAYSVAVNEVREPLGRSLHQVLGRICGLQTLPQAPHPEAIERTMSAADVATIRTQAAALSRAWGPVARGEDFVWRDLKVPTFDQQRKVLLTFVMEAASSAWARVRDATLAWADKAGIPWNRRLADGRRVSALSARLRQAPDVPCHWLTAPDLDGLVALVNVLDNLSGEYKSVAAELLAAAGPRWEELDPGSAARLRQMSGPAKDHELVTDRSNVPSVSTTASFLESTAQCFGELVASVGFLASVFKVPPQHLSIRRAFCLAQLGRLGAAAHRPEASWLDHSTLAKARQAADALESVVGDWQRLRDEVTSVFSPTVLQLDLEGLCVRFETVHVGFGKLRSQYRTDKRLLSEHARSGRVRESEVNALPNARSWQRLDERLQRLEREHADLLGEYYRREAPNFAAMREALALAETLLRLAGELVPAAALREVLARDRVPDSRLVSLSETFAAAFEGWEAEAIRIGGEAVSRLADHPTDSAGPLAKSLASLLQRMSALMQTVTQVCGEPSADIGKIQYWLDLRAREFDIAQRFAAAASLAAGALGRQYRGLSTEWSALRASLVWANEVRALLGQPVSIETATELLPPPSTGRLDESLTAWDAAIGALVSNFEDDYATRIQNRLDGAFEEARALLEQFAATIEDIAEWDAYVSALSALGRAGVGEPADYCVAKQQPADDVPGIIERACLERWADLTIAADSRLSLLRHQDREQLVTQFRSLDRRSIELASGRVIQVCNARRPNTLAGAAGIIAREAEKQRRHRPVRQLMSETGVVVQAIKPCFMMSPLSVSQFLPADMRFDVVVFDEASQVRPPDAINCVYRTQQLIVAGDQKQLPPTSFFETTDGDGGDEWQEDQLEDFESVLDVAKGCGSFTSLPLRWHYRSQHEDLITFSNYSFYRGKLITFPSANIDDLDLGLELFAVQGVYRRGGARDNPVEVQKVVERIAFHRTNHPHLTVGVVAFSEAQAAAIEAEIRRCEHVVGLKDFLTEDRLRGGFVKNLETVQGDERDIIIFSVGYGRDEVGKFTMNFGPVNRQGGERRLNVAITRARRRIEVVASITEADFVGDINSDGVRHLRRYLDFAGRQENRIAALAIPLSDSGGDVESPFEDEVARTIRSWGYEVVPQVGCAGYRVDLGVRHPARPGTYALGIECDGRMYHSSRVARDRDRLRQEVLERLGWRLYRIWGPAWYRSRKEQEARLHAAIQQATSHDSHHVATEPVRPAGNGGCVQIDPDEPPAWTLEYSPVYPSAPRFESDMYDSGPLGDLRRMIKAIVKGEGPVASGVVLKRIRDACGFGRTGSRIRAAFDAAVTGLRTAGDLHLDNDSFLYERGQMPLLKVRRASGGELESVRGAQEVPPAEMQLAITRLVQDARVIEEDELTSRVASLFGWNRRGTEIEEVLTTAVRTLVRRGVLFRKGDRLESATQGG